MFDFDYLVQFLTGPQLVAFAQVIGIDLLLAGDNAIVISLAAAALPADQRRKAILYGIIAATVMRIGFALVGTVLFHLTGLLLAGGFLLLWVCWKFWRELEHQRLERRHAALQKGEPITDDERKELEAGEGALPGSPAPKTLRQAIVQIVIADVSMSLDNVLAVVGAARDHPWVLVFGLGLSVALMGIAATFIATLLKRWPVIAYIGLAIIFYVAGKMIWDGWWQIQPMVTSATQ